jgi:hypothetical protein
MSQVSNAKAIMGAMSLLTAATPMIANQSPTVAAHDQKVDQLNMMSLNSMESTWLKVPHLCKARAFHATASSKSEEMAAQVKSIYASFGA